MLAIPACTNDTDAALYPAGGTVHGTGIALQWQNGPVGRDADPIHVNGVSVETVIYTALQRLVYYQSTRVACREHALAITKLEEALLWLSAPNTEHSKLLG